MLAVLVASSHGPLTVLITYRPGSELASATFFNEFAVLLQERYALHNTQLVIAGDLNFHLEDLELTVIAEFAAITEQSVWSNT